MRDSELAAWLAPWGAGPQGDEAEIVAAERCEQGARPESLRSTTSVRAEESYDEDGIDWVRCGEGACYHWRNDLPCPVDPWGEVGT